ncbi:MAG: 50S ribosomal protein L9 [Methylococcus sp.]|jgi:large subunit ribosomal protein L9|nr:MAG: 50S ribosomal protein L9 [Methylococcus sp.]
MELILLEKISNLGDLGDQVTVKSGYGRNFLVPTGKAVLATPEKLAEFEGLRAELEAKAGEGLSLAEKRRDSIEELAISITQKAGEEGKLFGSVGTLDIAEAASEAGVPVEKSEIRLSDGTLRHTGDFEIDVQLHTDVVAKLKLSIVAE